MVSKVGSGLEWEIKEIKKGDDDIPKKCKVKDVTTNIIGTANVYKKSVNTKTKEVEYDLLTNSIFKYNRVCSYKIYWEKQVYDIATKFMPMLKAFPKMYEIKETPVMIDKQGFALHRIVQEKSDLKAAIQWDVVHSDLIKGCSLESYIKNSESISFKWVIYKLKELMGKLRGFQKHTKFSHFDLAARNVFIGVNPVPNEIEYHVYLWDGEDKPIIAPSDGSSLNIIDLEFAYVSGIEQKGLSPRLDLMEWGFFPFFFDPECDPIYSIMSSLELYAEHHQKNQAAPIVLNRLHDVLKKIYNKDIKLAGSRKRIIDFIKTEIFEYLENAKEFENMKSQLSEFIHEFHHHILEFLFHGMKWDVEKSFFISKDLFEKYPKPATMSSEEIEQWLQQQEKKHVGVIDKISGYFSTENIETAKQMAQKSKNYQKDTSIQFEGEGSNGFKNIDQSTEALIQNRNYIYRVYLKICKHLLSIFKPGLTQNRAQIFIILKKLTQRFQTKANVKIDNSFENIVKYFDLQHPFKWEQWYLQFTFYKSLISTPLFEMYRQFGKQSFANHNIPYDFETNIKNHYSETTNKLYFDPWIAYKFLETVEVREPPIESETKISIYQPTDSTGPTQFVIGEHFSKEEIHELNIALEMKDNVSFLTILKERVLF